MAKFCGICGAASEDYAQVCGNCGAPFAPAAPAAAPAAVKEKKNIADSIKIPGLEKLEPSKQALVKKIILIAVPAVALILILAILLGCVILPNTGYKGTINKYLNAIEKEDTDKYMELVNAYDFDGNDDADDYIDDYLKDLYDDLEYRYGENIKLSFKVTDADKLTDDRIKDIQDMYEEGEDCDNMEISKGYDVQGTLTIKGKDMDRDFEEISFIVIKEDGQWKIWTGWNLAD